ncbi:MAG: hypothetical protein WDN24_06815 [Sphingomonas sp.]
MRIAFLKCHGSGNDFPLVDARALGLTDAEWAGIARALADRGGPVGGDGLLLLTQGDDRHAFGMRMFNPDGSEAETCLNGLRCVARLGFELTGADSALVRLKTSSAEAARAPELAPGVATVRTRVGPASTALRDVGLRTAAAEAIDATVPELPSGRRFTAGGDPQSASHCLRRCRRRGGAGGAGRVVRGGARGAARARQRLFRRGARRGPVRAHL